MQTLLAIGSHGRLDEVRADLARASQPLAAKAGAAKANKICFSLMVFGSAMTTNSTSRVPRCVAVTSVPRTC